jgi:hypothetical protein
MHCSDSYPAAPASMTLKTYRFDSQPASSTSYAHYTRRQTDRRSRIHVDCTAGSRQRFANASSFSRAGIPHAGNTREKNSGRQSVAGNPCAHTDDRMGCIDHFTLLKRFSATPLAVGDARSGHGRSRPSPGAWEWRSDGGAEWVSAERTYCRRVRKKPAAVLAADRLSAVHEVWEKCPSSG